MAMVVGGSVSYAYASSTLSNTQHREYISKTLSATVSDSISGENVIVIGFNINKINNASDQASSYKKIKMKFVQSYNNGDGMWLVGCGYGGDGIDNGISGQGTNSISFTAIKGIYYEAITGLMNGQSTNCNLYYYGNDPDLAAYAYMQEDWS